MFDSIRTVSLQALLSCVSVCFALRHREMILRRPHEFKIATLSEIRALFPPEWNPFYAGFGNRDTDEISYKAVSPECWSLKKVAWCFAVAVVRDKLSDKQRGA